jgi:pimeloyl-ACP methyl ester carboxylesterase
MLSGRQDIRAPIDIIEKNYKRLPKGELAVFENCGHLPEIEHPQKFIATVSAFLAADGGRPSGAREEHHDDMD